MPARYDARTALIIVDVQNDFADAGGSLYVRGGESVVPRINAEVEAAAAAGALIACSQDWHPPSTPHFQKDGGVWPVHCLAESWGAAFHPGLRLPEDVRVIRKGTGGEDGYSAFSVRDPRSGASRDTELGAWLRQHAIERVVIAGLATDYCVKETALDALRLGLQVEVLGDAVKAVDLQPGDGERALAAVVAAGGRVL
jgi:nicotinamidase/pyrazinamidase